MVLFGPARAPASQLRPNLLNGWLDELWADILSGDAERIQCAWDGLGHAERQALLDHLARMRHDEGWQPAQRESAAAAEKVIHNLAR